MNTQSVVMVTRLCSCATLALLLALGVGCSSTAGAPPGGGKGGATAGSGGASPSGGSQGSGGSPSSGGALGSGGVAPSGGSVGSGGAVGRGGALGSGGVTGTGGSRASGGAAGSGGNSGSGGASSGGGVSATGGASGSGGNSGGGGTSVGGSALGGGGAISSGGNTARGGSSGTGGTTAGSGGTVDGGASSGGDAGGSVKSAGCGNTPTLKNSPGTTINYNKVASGRQYILRLPDNYDNNHPYRLILSYHWATGSASQVFNCKTESISCYTTQSPFFGLLALANNTTIFIAPDGTGGLWSNTGGADVTFTDDILKQVEADLCIDTSHVELEGFSMGGAMTITLLCQRPGVFSAGVAHSAGGQPMPTSCQPVPYFASLGSQEAGGQTSTADFFAKSNGCTAETLPKAPTGGHICSDYKGCSAGHPVHWCPFDGGHTPSPVDSGQSTTWMPKEVWTFLTQF